MQQQRKGGEGESCGEKRQRPIRKKMSPDQQWKEEKGG